MTRYVAVFVGALALFSVGCPEKPKQEQPAGEGEKGGTAPKVKAGPEDPKFTKADPIDAVTVETVMSQELEAEKPGQTAAEKAAVEALADTGKFKINVAITDNRSRMTIAGNNMPMPEGTFIVHDGPNKRYCFVAAGKKEYRILPSTQIASLFEGGPSTGRSNYQITVTDTGEKKTIAGFEATKANVELSFDWKVKFENKTKTGKTTAKLAVFHSADPKLKDSWGKEMIDFVTLPFQDDEGKKVVETLKAKLKFPLEWKVEIKAASDDNKDAKPAIITTTAAKVTVGQVPGNTFQIPPPGMTETNEPWSPGKGKVTVSEDQIAKLREKPEPKKPGDGGAAAPEGEKK